MILVAQAAFRQSLKQPVVLAIRSRHNHYARPGLLIFERSHRLWMQPFDLRREAARQDAAELLPMLAGQGAALAGPTRPAGEIVAELVAQTTAAWPG